MKYHSLRKLILIVSILTGLSASVLFGQDDPFPDLELSEFAYAIIPTEINYNPPEAGLDSTAFIEFYNRTDQPIDMTGFQVLAGVEYIFSETIEANGFLILAYDGQAVKNRFNYQGQTADWTSGGLSPSGEWIVLVDAEGKAIFKLRYDDEAPWPEGNGEGEVSPDGGGSTLVLANTFGDVTDPENWTVSKKQVDGLLIGGKSVYGSPGELESDGLVLLSAVKDSDTQITIIFSAEVQTNGTNPEDFSVQDGKGTSFPVSAQSDGTPGDAEIVLTVADLSLAVGDLTVTYTNNNDEISDLAGSDFAETSDATIDLDSTAPAIVRATKDSDTQITLVFDEPVQINADAPLNFELYGDNLPYNITSWANGTNDNEIVLTVADLSEAAPMLDLSYNNQDHDIVDFGANSSPDFSVTVCPDGFSCEEVSETICSEESFTLNSGRSVTNPETVPYDTVGTEITRYDLTIDTDINCCPDGFTCNIIDATECANSVYTSPLGNTTSEAGTVVDMDYDNQIRNTYNVTFDRAEVTADIYSDGLIAASGSVTYEANTNATGVLSFDNSQNYWVELNSLQDDLNGTSRSIFMWIKTGNVASSEQILFGINPANSGSTITNLFIDDNGDNLEINDGGTNRSASFNVSGEVWNYVGYTYDASTSQTIVYVNGIENQRFTNSQLTTADSRYSLGQEFDSNESNHYNGDMAEISVWNEVLTGAEIQAAMQAKINNGHPKFANLVGYYSVFGDCDDDVAVLKDHSGNGNDGIFQNGFTQDFKNVQSIDGFNAIDWYTNLSWKKDGTEVSTVNTYTADVAAGNYELVASRNFIQSTDTWTMMANSNATTVDLIADETLCADDPITRTVPTNTVNYLDFEETEDNSIKVNGLADAVAGKDRSVFMWLNKESSIGSGDFNEVLVFQDADVDNLSRFYIRDTERLALWDGTNDRLNSSALSNDTWYFVGYTYDHTTGETKLYLNGTEEDSGILDMPLGEGWFATLGAKYNDNGLEDHLDGKLAEITIWDKVLTQEEVTSLMAAAPAHNATNLVAAYGMLKSIADNQLRDLTANGNDGLVSHETIFVTNEEVELTDYKASANYTFSWKKAGTEFDTDANAEINVEEGTTNYSVFYGSPFFPKTEEFALSFTDLIPTEPLDQTAGVTGSTTFEVAELEGASYQWYKVAESRKKMFSGNIRSIHTEGNNVFVATEEGGFKVSFDGGVSWSTRLPDLDKIYGIYGLGNNIYVGIFGGNTLAAVAISKDLGENWNYTTNSQKGFPSSFYSTSVYSNGSTTYAAARSYLAYTTNDGSSWSSKSKGQSNLPSEEMDFVFGSGENVYVGSSFGGFSRSSNDGSSWSRVSSGSNGFSTSNEVNSIYAIDDKVYVATLGGLSISEDKGVNWTTIGEGDGGFPSNSVLSVFAEGDNIYVGPSSGGLYVSTDAGSSWQLHNGFEMSDIVLSIRSANDKIYAGTENGLLILEGYTTLHDQSNHAATNQTQGTTTHQLTISNTSLDQSNTEFFVVVSKDGCTQQSDHVTLTVLDVPVVSGYTPENRGIDIALDTELSMEFSKTVTAGTGELKIYNYATDALVQTFTLSDLTIDGSTVSISSAIALEYGTQYYVTLDADLVKDGNNAGNLAITDKDTWSFHTICEPLVLTQPADQAGFVGGSVTLSVPEVADASYQWFKKGSGTFSKVTEFGNDNVISRTNALQSSFIDGDTWYIGTSKGLSISTDGGETWSLTSANENGFGSSSNVLSVFVDGDNVYAGTSSGLSISNDGGNTWGTTTAGQTGMNGNIRIRTIFAEGDNIFAGTDTGDPSMAFSDRLSISIDGGQTWRVVNAEEAGFSKSSTIKSIFVENDNVYVGTGNVGSLNGGLSISKDGGTTWTTITKDDEGFADSNFIYSVYAQGQNIYVGTEKGFAFSADGGENWSSSIPNIEGFSLRLVESVFAVGEKIYAGGNKLFLSTDQGLSWTDLTPEDFGRITSVYETQGTLRTESSLFGLASLNAGEPLINSSDQNAANAISAADTRELTISNLDLTLDQSEYFVVVTKGDCKAQSNLATLTVTDDVTGLPLQIVSSTPEDGATEFNGTTITLTFNKDVFANRGRVGVFDASNDVEVLGMGGADSRISINGSVVTIDLGDALPVNKEWYLLMRPNTFKDAVGNNFEGIWDKEEINFSSPGTISLVSSNPENDSQGFSATTMTFTFNKPVIAGVGRISIYDVADDTEITGAGVGSSRVSINGEVVTLDLINPLPLDKELYVNIPVSAFKDANDLFFEGILDKASLRFKGPTTPELISSLPSDNAVNYNGTTLTLTFDRNMSKGLGRISILDASDDTEITGAGVGSGRVVVSDNVVTLDLINPLPLDKSVYVSIPGSAFKDVNDSFFPGILNRTTLDFTSATTPELTTTLPSDGAVNYNGTTLTLTFDRNMSKGLGRISILDASDDTEITGAGVGSGRVVVSDNVVTIDLINPLPLDKSVYVNIPASAFKDVNDSFFPGVLDKTTLDFTSATTPMLSSTMPVDNAVGFGGSTITFSFDRNMLKGVGRIQVFDAADDSEITGAGVGSSRVSIANNEVTMDLINPIPLDKEVYVNIPASAFKDESGNFFGGVLDKTTLNFSGLTAPKLLSSLPADDAVDFSGSTVTFTFDRNIFTDVGRVSVLSTADDTEVTGAGVGSSRISIVDNVVTFDLINALPTNASYYVSIPGRAFKDANGNYFERISDKNTLNFSTNTVAPSERGGGLNLNSVFENSATGIKLFPNPVRNTLNIDLTGFEGAEIRIADVTGKVLFQKSEMVKTSMQLNVSSYKEGVYLVQVKSMNGDSVYIKFIVRH